MERTQGFRPRRSFFTALLIVMTGLPFAAQAAPVTWHLVDVVFQDGATASGSFTYDASLNLYSAIDIRTTTGPTGPGLPVPVPGFSYLDLLPGWASNDSQVYFTLSVPIPRDFYPAMRFRFASPLTDAGGIIDLLISPLSEFPFDSVEGHYLLPVPGRPSGTISWRRRVIFGRVMSEPVAAP